ncbi:aldehyde dehydrogenase family protein [Variovorax sp. ZS18.2.2]|uniref:aldehyde dehydrogenase family protein n=1 Tax=Variovorax sp. ZS18.2.2 TaxID=2971255 RepID=UPI002150CB77|nr:aldehyde dehydrogenase family protein [Variovorax sp. ZS18.2.2]MCR6478193.1 aldehyde dehydrogenase family protein [Variovorax sp. ZS18.2.2]
MKIIDRHYIDGRFVPSHGTATLDLASPVTLAPLARVTLGDEVDARRAIGAARRAFASYSKTSVQERAGYLQAIHDAILARFDEHIAVRTEEYGGVAKHSRFSIAGAAKVFLNMKKTLEAMPFSKKLGEAEVVSVPVGVAALITPWNSAVFMVCNKLAPALAAGCTVVVKPSELSAQQTRLLVECIHAAGLPPGVVNIVNGTGEAVGNVLSMHPDVAKVSFTGSTAVGKTIMRNAAETMKRVTLELGGKSAHIVLDDADLAQAIPFALAVGFANNGQACIAGTRLLVPRSRLDEVTAALAEAVAQWKVGSPADADTQLGPLVNERQYERVQAYIRRGIEEGARLLVGGPGRPSHLPTGCFARPTVFVDVDNRMTIAREEIFGPVLAVIAYDTEEEAIAIANDSIYGLQGWISTTNAARGRAVAERIDAGMVMVNRGFDLLDEAGAPAGGFKQSGIGREFGEYGIREYLELKSVFVE